MNSEITLRFLWFGGEALLIILGYYFLFFKKFIGELGKQTAQLAIIKQKTIEIESVKHSFKQEVEALKAQLGLLNDRKMQVFTEEKDAIIQFYTKINEWIWDKLNITLLDYNSNKYDALSDRMSEMENTYNEVNVSFSKVSLLVDDSELIKAGHELIISTLKLHHLVTTLCSNYRHWLGISRANFEVVKNHINAATGKPFDSEFTGFVKDVDSELENIRKESYNTKQPVFNEAIKVKGKFEDLAKAYIRTPRR